MNFARRIDQDFNAILLQYFQERFLYRLAISNYKKGFILKGALSFLMYKMPRSRPTKDMDFLGASKFKNREELKKIIFEIAKISIEDGVKYDIEKLVWKITRLFSNPIFATTKKNGNNG